jgi:hypothetical protein
MKRDQNGWNGCDRVVCTSDAQRQAFRKRNDFWNDVQEVPAKRPFQVERLAQGDPTLGVSLGSDSTPFRSTSSPIGEPRNGSRADFRLKCRSRPEGTIHHGVFQHFACTLWRVAVASCFHFAWRTATGGKIEAGRSLGTQLSVAADKRISR